MPCAIFIAKKNFQEESFNKKISHKKFRQNFFSKSFKKKDEAMSRYQNRHLAVQTIHV